MAMRDYILNAVRFPTGERDLMLQGLGIINIGVIRNALSFWWTYLRDGRKEENTNYYIIIN